MPARSARVPKYCHFRPRNLAYVRVRGRIRYLGKYDSPESRENYRRVLAEMDAAPGAPPERSKGQSMTVMELCAAYLDHAEGYYVKDGRPTAQMGNVHRALRLLKGLYGHSPAAEFGPLGLRAIQAHMIASPRVDPRTNQARPYTRSTINATTGSIRRVFRWAVSNELLPVTVYQALATVPDLRRGRTAAREPRAIPPVSDQAVNQTLPHLLPIVADMVSFQRLTGARPSEVCELRPADLDRTEPVWRYRPASHKTEHHGRQRVIFVGPKAQAILRPYLLRPADACCFSPAEAMQEHLEARQAARKTPQYRGNRPGSNRKARPSRRPKDHYDKDAYRRAIERACERAFGMPAELRKVPKKATTEQRREIRQAAAAWRAEHCWRPNQLRHSAATEIRRQFGLEAAQTVLGHAKADVTQVYAERDYALAADVMSKIG